MQRTPTHDIFTSGIVNVPLSKELKDSRYTFFEIDRKDTKTIRDIIAWYIEMLGGVYVHETTNGYHFYNLRPIHKALYGKIVRHIKPLNPLCPMTTLRLLPNKWKGESKYWLKGHVLGDKDLRTLNRFKDLLEAQRIDVIKDIYQVVHYRIDRKTFYGHGYNWELTP